MEYLNYLSKLRPDFFISWFTNPPTVIFRKLEKKNSFFILSADSKYYLFCWKNNIYLRFYLCIFESDIVKSDCPVQIFRKIIKYLKIWYRLLVYHTSFTVDQSFPPRL